MVNVHKIILSLFLSVLSPAIIWTMICAGIGREGLISAAAVMTLLAVGCVSVSVIEMVMSW